MRSVLVIGASRGIGLELVRQLAATKRHQILASIRSPTASADLQALIAASQGRINLVQLEMTDPHSIRRLVERMKGELSQVGLDEIIVNAGAQVKTDGPLCSSATVGEDMMTLFKNNTVGPMLAIQGLLPILRSTIAQPKRIVLMSSSLGSLTTNRITALPIYSITKTALNMLGVKLSAELTGEVSVMMIHPGWVQTDMGGPRASITAEESVRGMLKVFDDDEKAGMKSGQFLNYKGDTLPW